MHPGLPVALVALGVAAFLPPLVQNTYVVSVAMQVEILMCLALGLNFVVGLCGMLDLGFAAFFAIGSYTTGLLSVDLHWPILATVPFAVVAALIGAVFIGTPTLRLRSDYLAVITLGFGEIIQNIVTNLNQTGGPEGISGIAPLSVAGLTITSTAGYFYVFLVLTVLFTWVSYRVRRSRLGRAWLAIREDEDTAQAMGIKVHRFKLYAYMAGSVYGSITGSLYGAAFIAIAPPSFGFNEVAAGGDGRGHGWYRQHLGRATGGGRGHRQPGDLPPVRQCPPAGLRRLARSHHGAAAPGHVAGDRPRSRPASALDRPFRSRFRPFLHALR